jgi:hypothetical protein
MYVLYPELHILPLHPGPVRPDGEQLLQAPPLLSPSQSQAQASKGLAQTSPIRPDGGIHRLYGLNPAQVLRVLIVDRVHNVLQLGVGG